MDNQEKARVYDACIYESDMLQRENSKIKSEHAGNIPAHLQEQIKRNEARIAVIVNRLESLFR